MSRDDDSTVVLTDITAVLSSAENEAQEKPAALLAVGGEINGTILDVAGDEVTIGRSQQNTYPLEFKGISRHHVKLKVIGDSVIASDMGSTNGTYLNNKKLESPRELIKGDLLKIGSIALKFIPAGDPERLSYDKLNQDANTDGLTGCYNKTFFNNAIETEVKKCKVTGKPLSLVVFDLDHFKKLNDNFGHDAGDYVLRTLANLIRKNGVREDDIFARYGGEEFVILLPKTNLKQAFEISERLRQKIESFEFVYDQKRLPVTASIGVADYRKGVITATDLFKRADSAVYVSKDNGRNQVNFYRD